MLRPGAAGQHAGVFWVGRWRPRRSRCGGRPAPAGADRPGGSAAHAADATARLDVVGSETDDNDDDDGGDEFERALGRNMRAPPR